jgi:hypothetical protein
LYFGRVAESLDQGGDRGSRTLVIARQEYGPRDRFSASIARRKVITALA